MRSLNYNARISPRIPQRGMQDNTEKMSAIIVGGLVLGPRYLATFSSCLDTIRIVSIPTSTAAGRAGAGDVSLEIVSLCGKVLLKLSHLSSPFFFPDHNHFQ